MLEFNKVSLDDKIKIKEILEAEKDRGCEYTFGNIFIWSDIYATKVAFFNGGLAIRHDKNGVGYLFPVGEYNLKTAIDLLLCDAREEGDVFKIYAADKEDFSRVDDIFPGVFEFKEERDYAEYIYLSSNLINLKGKKYQKKRNHISRFLREQPNYKFCRIDESNISRVCEMNDNWNSMYGCDDKGLREEHKVTVSALDNFFELDFDGGFIENEGKVLAYSIGERINDETYCIHIEKAYHEINGTYAIINRDFAREFCKDYKYINREDDLGVPGLRKSKLSYYPEFITDKITIRKKQ
jgi:hypothetical protein